MSNISKTENPLVSIIVLTFNSAKYVLETLESAKAQTYQNIELIISDDCSTDDTVEVCRKWLDENYDRFKCTKLITVGKNTGIAINCNRGLYAAQGVWIKHIAGDDILLPDALSAYHLYAKDHTDAKCIVSDIQLFGERNEIYRCNKKFGQLSARKQLKWLLSKKGQAVAVGSGGNSFILRDILIQIHGFDIRYPMIEDYPLSIRLVTNNIKIHILNKVCTKYRIRIGSASNDKSIFEKNRKMFKIVAIPIIKKKRMYLLLYHYYLKDMRDKKARKFPFNNWLFRRFLNATDIYSWKKLF